MNAREPIGLVAELCSSAVGSTHRGLAYTRSRSRRCHRFCCWACGGSDVCLVWCPGPAIKALLEYLQGVEMMLSVLLHCAND